MKDKNTKAIQKVEPQYPQTAEGLIAQAIAKGTPVATLERLLAMRREILAEQAKKAFDLDMAAFQFECPPIVKTKTVKTNTGRDAYSYTPIEVLDAETKALRQKYGFSYSSNMYVSKVEGTQVRVVLKVTHKAGHSELTEVTVPLGNKTNVMSESQVTVAAATFAKRHAFKNAFGLTEIGEDDEALLKKAEKDEQGLPTEHVAKIDAAKTQEELVELCRKITAEKPTLRNLIVVEYTRRKEELAKESSENIVNDADKALSGKENQ
jgi:hypothetical protein